MPSANRSGPSIPSPSSNEELLSRPHRLIVGLLILLLVDVIWVASSEFTKYIFDDLDYDKPYFSTYFKTSLFTTYLLGFLVYSPWRDLCRRSDFRLRRRNRRYRRILQQEDLSGDADEREALSASSGDGADTDDDTSYGTSRQHGDDAAARTLGSPTFVPVNLPGGCGGAGESSKSSGNESEADFAGGRRVRFTRLAQVVEMNPGEAIAANLSRLSYGASVRAQRALQRAASRLSVPEVLRISLAFTFPWFAGNYCYQRALSLTEAAVVNVLSSSSSLFTLLLAGAFPSEPADRITLSKLSAVAFNFCGVVLVSYADLKIEKTEGGSSLPLGVVWSLCGAFFYSAYIVLLRRKVHSEENMDPPMFFGFVGMFCTVLMFPGVFFMERPQWPTSKQLEFLVINGFVGTVLSELMWLCGCFYTSSLIATLATSLTIPMSILADVVWKHKTYEALFVIGTVPMFCSFFIVVLLTHYQDWDPLLDVTFRGFRTVCCCLTAAGRSRVPPAAASFVLDDQEEESESLMDSNASVNEDDAAASSNL